MKLFFAVDGSEESLAAVRQVGQLLSCKTDVAALYFAPPDVLVTQTTLAKEMQERATKIIAEAVFDEAKRRLPESIATNAKTILAQHPPREGILSEAEIWGADMIVVGARGLSGFERVLLGSVSRSVAYRSTLPVYVARPARPHAPAEPFRVLYAYDGSPCSEEALCVAQGLSYPADTLVTATTVMDLVPAQLPAWIAQGRPSAELDPVIQHWLRETETDKRHQQEKLAAMMQRQRAPFDRAEIMVTEGLAAEQLLRLIDARRIDLVVLGSGGKAAWKRLLIGSTSEKILNHAPCSVLLARERQFKETPDG